MDRAVFLVALILVIAVRTWGCPDERGAVEVLRAGGYTEIDAGGAWAGWSCGRGDASGTPFTAASAAGARVRGVVCCGLAGACDVRLSSARVVPAGGGGG